MKEMLTQEKLKELIEYDPDNGIVAWRVKRRGVRVGEEVGYLSKKGYRKFTLFGKNYFIHRLIWLYVTGNWPTEVMDHKNGNRADNRWCNLREATISENNRNRSMLQKNKTGYKGVLRSGKNVWIARIGGLSETIGRFDSPESASEAYAAESRKRYGNFSITERPVIE